MLLFYHVDQSYADKLREADGKVPNLGYQTHEKFFCGVVLEIDGMKYYAPISHDTKARQTTFVIYRRKRPLSSIKFSYMIPVPESAIELMDLEAIAEIDQKYSDLLQMERAYLDEHETEILKRAKAVYKIGCNKNHVLNKYCCDFKKLEEKMKQILAE